MKRGCDPSEHTIVHLDNADPVWLPGAWERGMRKEPILIQPTEQNEAMEPASRLRCGKLYSIGWNVKLRDIGMVPTHERTKLMRYYQEGQDKGFDNDEKEFPSQAQYLQPSAPVYYGYQQ